MHAGLLFFLWIGVQWQSSEPVAVEAEVWDMKAQAAAPAPEPTPEPTPVAPPPPPAPPLAPPVVAPAVDAPDIALERRKAKLRAEQEKEADRAAAKELATTKAKTLADAKLKALADAKEAAEAKAEAKAERDLANKKAAAKLAEAQAQRAAEEQQNADKARDVEMKRITGAVGTNGNAAQATSPSRDNGYVAAITSKIKNNIAYTGGTSVNGNPSAIYKIEQLPTGEIISVRKIKSSGIPGYDSAVENAIAKSSPLPKKKDGTVTREVEAVFNLKDIP